MKSNILKTTLASMALIASLSASAQSMLDLEAKCSPIMITNGNASASLLDMMDVENGTQTVYDSNIYLSTSFNSIIINDNLGSNVYKISDEVKSTDIETKIYIPKNCNETYCDIRRNYYDTIANEYKAIATRKLLTAPIIVSGVHLGDSIYCYDGMRFLASDLDTIPDQDGNWWIVNSSGNFASEYLICDNSSNQISIPENYIFYGFKANDLIFEVTGNRDEMGYEITPVHNASSVEPTMIVDFIPLEYGDGKLHELADGSFIKILPLSKGKYNLLRDNFSNIEGNHVIFIYSDNDCEYPTIFGNVLKTNDGYDISEVSYIVGYTIEDDYTSYNYDDVIDNNGKLNANAAFINRSGSCTEYISWISNYPSIFTCTYWCNYWLNWYPTSNLTDISPESNIPDLYNR